MTPEEFEELCDRTKLLVDGPRNPEWDRIYREIIGRRDPPPVGRWVPPPELAEAAETFKGPRMARALIDPCGGGVLLVLLAHPKAELTHPGTIVWNLANEAGPFLRELKAAVKFVQREKREAEKREAERDALTWGPHPPPTVTDDPNFENPGEGGP